MLKILLLPYRWWLRADLKWVNDTMADEVERVRTHRARMRNLQVVKAGIEHKLNGARASPLGSLWPKDRQC